MSAGTSTFFITGGTMAQDTPSYIERRADADLYQGLQAGEFCYVLTPRQIGKSSLMVRTAARLRDEGHTVVQLDLTTVGQNLTLEQWYYGLLTLMGSQLNLRAELRQFWLEQADLSPLQRFISALREVVLPCHATPSAAHPLTPSPPHPPTPRLVVFIDEIDTVLSLRFSTDEFFVAVRECYNRRATEPVMEGLTFCLLGVASPSDLIQDPLTTPFNVGRRVELHDFTPEEAAPLAIGLQLGATGGPLRSPAVAARLLRRILYWTDGHPYLTQRLCRAVAEDPDVCDRRGVDRVCRQLFLEPGARQRDDNLYFVQERILGLPGDIATYLDLYRQIRAGRKVRADGTDPRVPVLKLAGLVGEHHGHLRVRNRIYHHVFDGAWIQANLPDAEVRRQLAAYRRGLIRAGGLAGTVIVALGSLATTALVQTRRAEQLLTEMQIDRGVTRLTAGMPLGLLDLLQAYKTARHLPELQRSAGRLWAAWQPSVHQRLLSIVGHEAPATAVSFSRDGQLLASGTLDGEVRVWDTGTWQPVGAGLRLATDVYSLTWGPGNAWLAAQSNEGLQLWHWPTGKVLAQLKGEPTRCTAAAVSPDGVLAAVADLSGLRFWRAHPRGTDWKAGPYRPAEGVLSLAFTPDQRRLILGTTSGVEVWDTRLQRRIAQRRQTIGVEHIAIDPHGRFFVGISGRQAYRWPLEPGVLRPAEKISAGPIARLAFAPRSPGRLAALSPRGIDFLELSPGLPVRSGIQNAGPSQALAYSPQGTLAAAGIDGSIRIWNPTSAPEPAAHLDPGDFIFTCAAGAGGRFATLTLSGELREWPARSISASDAHQVGTVPLHGARFSPDGERLAVWNERKWALFQTSTGARSHVPFAFTPPISRTTFANHGRQALVTETSGLLHILDLTGSTPPKTIRSLPDSARAWAVAPALSSDGRYVAHALEAEVRLQDLRSGRETVHPIAKGSPIRALAFSPDARILFAAVGQKLRAWRIDRPSNDTLALECPEPIRLLALSPNGKYVAAASSANNVWTRDLIDRRTSNVPIEARERVEHLQFSPDGSTLATAFRSSVQLWDTLTGSPLGPGLQHRDRITEPVFTRAGRSLAVPAGRSLAVWSLPLPPRDVRQMEALTWAATGVRLKSHGELESLHWRELQRLRQQVPPEFTGGQ